MYILCIRRGPKLYKVYRGYTKPELYKKEMPPKKIHRLCSTHMMAYMYYKISSSKACSRVEKNTPGFTPNLIVKKSLPCQSFDFCQITQKTVFFFLINILFRWDFCSKHYWIRNWIKLFFSNKDSHLNLLS